VRITAISVNPVDAKIRSWMSAPEGSYRVLGWDAASIVAALGPQAAGFAVGARVFYAGTLYRQGTNAEFNWSMRGSRQGPPPRSPRPVPPPCP
jgi:NADPH:quinone reductase-like Zn-dependent oxidoreductase